MNTLEEMARSERIEEIKQKVKKDTARQIFREIQRKLKASQEYYEREIKKWHNQIGKGDYLEENLLMLVRCRAIWGFICVFSQLLDDMEAKYLPKKSKKSKKVKR